MRRHPVRPFPFLPCSPRLVLRAKAAACTSTADAHRFGSSASWKRQRRASAAPRPLLVAVGGPGHGWQMHHLRVMPTALVQEPAATCNPTAAAPAHRAWYEKARRWRPRETPLPPLLAQWRREPPAPLLPLAPLVVSVLATTRATSAAVAPLRHCRVGGRWQSALPVQRPFVAAPDGRVGGGGSVRHERCRRPMQAIVAWVAAAGRPKTLPLTADG